MVGPVRLVIMAGPALSAPAVASLSVEHMHAIRTAVQSILTPVDMGSGRMLAMTVREFTLPVSVPPVALSRNQLLR